MNFLSEMNDRKESEEGRMLIQNKIVSSQKHRMKKEEGATAAASHLPSLTQRAVRLLLSGRTGSQQRSLQTWDTLIKYQKRPTVVATAIFRIQLIGPPKQMKQIQDAE